jgi:hypothetical protein
MAGAAIRGARQASGGSAITDPSQDGYHDTSTDDAGPGQPAPMWETPLERVERHVHVLAAACCWD